MSSAPRLTLRKPGASRPSETPPPTPPPPPAEPPVSAHALRHLRAKCAQLERALQLATAAARTGDAAVAEAVTALDSGRERVARCAAAAPSEELRALESALDSSAARLRGRASQAGSEVWQTPFQPAGGNRFLAQAAEAGGWGAEPRPTSVSDALCSPLVHVQAARVAALEELLSELAPLLQDVAARLGEGSLETIAHQATDQAARQLAELAALAPSRGYLYGAPPPPRAPSRPAPARVAASKPAGKPPPDAAAAAALRRVIAAGDAVAAAPTEAGLKSLVALLAENRGQLLALAEALH